ncbi:5-amino-6-(5-phosphoribosylamino)uracil reductase [Bacillus sp. J14TS2]|uniref:RibD family protein n=1 Tax=Bacillus sp. J14TS2 TaxID=2807188 RepID=UPI001B256A28|nr:RibD family protein [Bacillus sp. J14TS2]GIN74515.1 5-amino-6-(5-phosphoribosylamino)uracil reductase [Bacillus sp. J14TS2]
MNRPYVFCHMQVSLDGKIIGNYMGTPKGKESGKLFYNLAFGENPHYQHQGWLSGRTTTDDNFTKYQMPNLDEEALIVPEGDFVVDTDLPKYYISIDPSGKLGWTSNTLNYQSTQAHVIEVLTEQASNAYKALLRKLNISYIIAGKAALDYGAAMQKLKELFNIETLMLGGGGVLNWSFIQEGLCDEVSIVISPTADGSSTAPSLFEAKEGLSVDTPVGFALKAVEAKDDGSVWLRYTVNNN